MGASLRSSVTECSTYENPQSLSHLITPTPMHDSIAWCTAMPQRLELLLKRNWEPCVGMCRPDSLGKELICVRFRLMSTVLSQLSWPKGRRCLPVSLPALAFPQGQPAVSSGQAATNPCPGFLKWRTRSEHMKARNYEKSVTLLRVQRNSLPPPLRKHKYCQALAELYFFSISLLSLCPSLWVFDFSLNETESKHFKSKLTFPQVTARTLVPWGTSWTTVGQEFRESSAHFNSVSWPHSPVNRSRDLKWHIREKAL